MISQCVENLGSERETLFTVQKLSNSKYIYPPPFHLETTRGGVPVEIQ